MAVEDNPAARRCARDGESARPGAEPEEIMAIKVPAVIIPGDDPAHARSPVGAQYSHPDFAVHKSAARGSIFS